MTAVDPWDWSPRFLRDGEPLCSTDPLPHIRLGRLWPADEPFKKPTAFKRRERMNPETAAAIPDVQTPATTTAVATVSKESRALAASAPVAVEGLEAFTARDMIVPDLKLGQAQSREEGVVGGKFYSSLDVKEHYDQLRLVAIAFHHGRVLFPKGADGKPDYDAEIPCRSDDGKTPSIDIEKPIAPKCTDAFGEPECVNAKWGGQGQKPSCTESGTLLVVNVDTGVPYRFSVKGSDVTTLRKFLSNVVMRAMPSKRSLFDFEFTLGNTKVKNDKGTWWAPTFSDLKPLEAGTHRRYFEMFAGKVKAPAPPVENTPAPADASGSVIDAANKVAADEKKKAEPPKKSAKGREMDFS